MEQWEDTSEDEHQEIERISSVIEKTRSQPGDEDDLNARRRSAVPERIRRVSYTLKARNPSEKSSFSDINDEDIKAILKNKPEGDLSRLYASGTDKEIEERAYRILFPLLKKSVAMFKKYSHLDRFGDLKIACAVCPELKQFQGWEALLLHARDYWKSCPHQHKGYYKALTDAFEAEKFLPKPGDPVVWPPVLLVDNSGVNFEGSLRKWRGFEGEQVPHTLKDLQVEEIIAVYKKTGQNDSCVLVFPGSEVGRVDARGLNKVLETGGGAGNGVLSIRLPNGDKPVVNGRLEQFMNLRLSNGDKLRRRSTVALEDVPNLKRVAEEEEECDSGESEQSSCSSGSEDDYEDNHPLAKGASTKQIKDMEAAVELMDKFGETFQGLEDLCAFPHTRPFRKSKMLQEMDAKFQEHLKSVGSKGAAVNPEIRAQLEKIDKLLRKEKLQWLKEINRIREQIEITGESEPQVCPSLEKQVHIMRMGKTKFAERAKLEDEQFKVHQRHLKHINFKKKRQFIKASQNRCDALLAAWQLEKEAFGRQAEIIRFERDILNNLHKNDLHKAQSTRRIYSSINAESDTRSDDDCSDNEKSKVVNCNFMPERLENLKESENLGKSEKIKKTETWKNSESSGKTEKPKKRNSVRFSLSSISVD